MEDEEKCDKVLPVQENAITLELHKTALLCYNMHQNDENRTKIHVVVIGGGLAGLSVLLAFLQHKKKHASDSSEGFRCDIYDRDGSIDARKNGYGLTLTYNPKGPLEALDVLEDLALLDSPSRCHYVFDSHGRVLGFYGNTFREDGILLPQRGNMRIARGGENG